MAITCAALHLRNNERILRGMTMMIGSFATFPSPFAWPSRAGRRVGRVWRRSTVSTRAPHTPASAAPAARVPVVEDASAWTTEEQQYLRALREAGL